MNPEDEELELLVQTQLTIDVNDYIIIDKPLSQNEEDSQQVKRIEEIIKILEKTLSKNGINATIT